MVSPLCSCGILPVVITLAMIQTPLAPLMALLVTSPVMGPDALILTWSALGTEWAVLKVVGAGALGLSAGLVTQLLEAREDRRLERLLKQLGRQDLLILDELGYVPFTKAGAELLFEVISQCYERGSIIITSNLPFDEWTGVFGSERLTGALLDRLTHHVHILEMNGESYRLKHSRNKQQ